MIQKSFFDPIRILAMRILLVFLGRWATAVLLIALTTPAHAGRYALVVGNDSYQHISPLKNARADAKAMAEALRTAGFKVSLATDQKQGDFKKTLRNFKSQLQGGDEVIVFYAGHGVQIAGANYLLPIDMAGEDEEQVKDEAVSLQRVLDDLQDQKAKFSLAIVDACRDNPVKGRGRTVGTRGLAPTTAVDGQMILFSAGTGQQALDRLGDGDDSPNSLFTRIFVKEAAKPGVPIHQALRNVRTEVVRLAKSVNHQQTPAIYDQSTGEFFLKRGAPEPDALPVVVAEPVREKPLTTTKAEPLPPKKVAPPPEPEAAPKKTGKAMDALPSF